MKMLTLRPTADRLRFAVGSGNFGEVDRLLVQYRGEVESCWREASAEERKLIAQETMSLLNWARRTILASRAQAQRRHAQFVRQSAYAGGGLRRSAVNLNA